MKSPARGLVLLIDFDDGVPARQNDMHRHIPESMQQRVYVLGVCPEPAQWRTASNKKFQAIGEALADECALRPQICGLMRCLSTTRLNWRAW